MWWVVHQWMNRSRKFGICTQWNRLPQVAQILQNSPAMRETCVCSLGWEDPLEEDMATHSSILTWRIIIDRGAWRTSVHGVTKSQSDMTEQLKFSPSMVKKLYSKIRWMNGWLDGYKTKSYKIIINTSFFFFNQGWCTANWNGMLWSSRPWSWPWAP